MKAKLLALAFSITLLAFGTAEAGSSRMSVEPILTPVTINKGESPLLAVKFMHSSHSGISCDTCHHGQKCAICHHPQKAPVEKYASCGSTPDCHVLPGKSKDIKSRFMAFHKKDTTRSCYGCHSKLEGQYADFQGCRPCHMPEKNTENK